VVAVGGGALWIDWFRWWEVWLERDDW